LAVFLWSWHLARAKIENKYFGIYGMEFFFGALMMTMMKEEENRKEMKFLVGLLTRIFFWVFLNSEQI
jgi:hypothetical protein